MSKLKKTVKKWFLNFLKPPQEQFHYWMDSTWFKDEKIPVNNIGGLSSLLNEKADKELVTVLTGSQDNKTRVIDIMFVSYGGVEDDWQEEIAKHINEMNPPLVVSDDENIYFQLGVVVLH